MFANVGQGGKEKHKFKGKSVEKSDPLSQENTPKLAKGLKLAVLVNKDGEVNLKDKFKKEPGVVIVEKGKDAIEAITQMRFWNKDTAK